MCVPLRGVLPVGVGLLSALVLLTGPGGEGNIQFSCVCSKNVSIVLFEGIALVPN